MSIPSDKFKEIHSAVSKAGRDRWVGFYVRANLHDDAHHCVDEVLTAAGYSLFDDEVEHEEVDDLVAAYEEGFRSSANKHEVDELKKTIDDWKQAVEAHLKDKDELRAELKLAVQLLTRCRNAAGRMEIDLYEDIQNFIQP